MKNEKCVFCVLPEHPQEKGTVCIEKDDFYVLVTNNHTPNLIRS